MVCHWAGPKLSKFVAIESSKFREFLVMNSQKNWTQKISQKIKVCYFADWVSLLLLKPLNIIVPPFQKHAWNISKPENHQQITACPPGKEHKHVHRQQLSDMKTPHAGIVAVGQHPACRREQCRLGRRCFGQDRSQTKSAQRGIHSNHWFDTRFFQTWQGKLTQKIFWFCHSNRICRGFSSHVWWHQKVDSS